MADDSFALPKLIWDSTSDPRPRKRARLSPAFSSDPAFFSSDDDPSVDNYTQERRKRQFRGPWYNQEPAFDSAGSRRHDSPKKKRIFERKYDSGVYMGSDGTDVDADMNEAVEELQAVSMSANAKGIRGYGWRSSQTTRAEPSAEEMAQQQIEICLDNGNECIDLSARGLTTLSNDTLRPLLTFTRVPPVTEGVFYGLEPMLKVFLASNKLSTLPEALFNLRHLTVLSLRANQIHELPPAIGRLHNLNELNISQNGLQYLPFEILDLFQKSSRLQSLQIHPNPFHEPHFPLNEDAEYMPPVFPWMPGQKAPRNRPRRGAICGVSPEYKNRTWHPQWKLCYKARTQVRYLDLDGAHLHGPKLSHHTLFGPKKFPNGIPIADIDDTPTPPTARGNPVSRAPSLLELSLQACSRTPELPYLAAKLPEMCPPAFPSLLDIVAAKKESGGSNCTICKRNFIIPRTEWIEWWEISRSDNINTLSAASPLRQMENERDLKERMVPLVRRGCSWLCVPEKVVTENSDDGEMDVDGDGDCDAQ